MTDALPKTPITIRPATRLDMDQCAMLVRYNWGDESCQRVYDQFVESLNCGQYDPQFFVAQPFDGSAIVGFCAMRKSMLMNGFWEFIWVAVHEDHQGRGIGEMLTDYRLDVVRENGGTAAILVTQKPKYFNRFGFITSQDCGNGWVVMTCQLKLADMK